jgi:enoyl-[acyl-carrier protein] reductase I
MWCFISHVTTDLARYNTFCMSKLLAGKTALVLGVANKWSLAYAISSAFVREGASLVLTYQSERQKQTVEELGGELGASKILPCDVTKQDELDRLVSDLTTAAPVIDALVHSIAFANPEDLRRPFLETSRDGFLLAQEVSAYSLVTVSRAIAPLMTNGGSITTLTYIGSTRVVQNYNVMGVAKASLEMSMRYLASDLGPKKIRVNAISAGPVKTASARGIKDFSKVLGVVAALAPLRKNTDPAEVADTAVFLASDLGRGVTGNVVYVDGGFQIIGLGLSE